MWVKLSPPSRFDLIFLDANKDGYLSYYQTIMDNHLLLPGGLLLVDNSLMKVCGCVGVH
jgi:predicted O-methyltransferase YrrM